MKVSVLLLTYNEAANLPRCLDALAWCDDIVVVDSGSTDDSVAIARRYNARILQRPFDNFAAQRNFGLEQGDFRNDWILHLDADEVVTPAFSDRLRTLQAPDAIDAYYVPSKIILFDRWLKHAGMYPAYQVRLGRRGRLRFVQVGHGQREDLAPDRIAIFDEPYLHYSFSRGLRSWLEKHVVYAEAEARELMASRQKAAAGLGDVFGSDPVRRRRAAKALANRMPLFLRPLFRFAYVYVLRAGFLDGVAGFCYACMLTVYEANIAILAYELARSRQSADT